MLRGVRPFLSDKYDLTKHPDYKYTADADKKYLFDIERYMKRRPAIVKPDEPFLCVWGGINLLEGYGQDNPASNAHVS